MYNPRISIHALREESDDVVAPPRGFEVDFNPRSPWGERRDKLFDLKTNIWFQSTLSVRRATTKYLKAI